MVTILKKNNNKGFPLNENGLLYSISKWHNEKGVPVEINVELTDNRFKPNAFDIQVDYQLINGLSQARLLKLDENGKSIDNELGNGKEMYIEEIPEKIPDRIRGWWKLTNNDEGDEEFIIYPKSKAYQVIHYLFQKEGLIPENIDSVFTFDWDELEPLMNDFKFNLKVKQIKGSNGSYLVPVVAPYDDGVTQTVTGD